MVKRWIFLAVFKNFDPLHSIFDGARLDFDDAATPKVIAYYPHDDEVAVFEVPVRNSNFAGIYKKHL